jgi:transcription elongation GreA/GreB family factor
MKRVYLTDVGFKKHQEELKWIEEVHLPEVQRKLNELRKNGDTKSAQYKKMKDERDFYQKQVLILQDILDTAKLIGK